MKKIFIFLLSVCFLSLLCAQQESFFQKTISVEGASANFATDIVTTSDSGYLCLGLHIFDSKKNTVVSKFNSRFEPVWNKTIMHPSININGNKLLETSRGNYIIAGTGGENILGGMDMILIKTDQNGDTLWVKAYGGSKDDKLFDCIESHDSGYVMLGSTKSFGFSNNMFYVVKTNKNGLVLWSSILGASAKDEPKTLIQTNDSGYLIAGNTYNAGTSSDDFQLIKLDKDGITEWNKCIGEDKYESLLDILQCSDNGYFICGTTRSFGSLDQDMYVVKTDQNGNIL